MAHSGVLQMPQPDEQVLGGHAVLAVGYDDASQRFIVRNSWGTDWGQAGYFTMPYAYLTDAWPGVRLLDDAHRHLSYAAWRAHRARQAQASHPTAQPRRPGQPVRSVRRNFGETAVLPDRRGPSSPPPCWPSPR